MPARWMGQVVCHSLSLMAAGCQTLKARKRQQEKPGTAALQQPANPRAARALDYLKRHGLQGNPLRAPGD